MPSCASRTFTCSPWSKWPRSAPAHLRRSISPTSLKTQNCIGSPLTLGLESSNRPLSMRCGQGERAQMCRPGGPDPAAQKGRIVRCAQRARCAIFKFLSYTPGREGCRRPSTSNKSVHLSVTQEKMVLPHIRLGALLVEAGLRSEEHLRYALLMLNDQKLPGQFGMLVRRQGPV